MSQESQKNIPASSLSSDSAVVASRSMAIDIARLAHDRHMTEIVLLELAGRSPVAKHFIICTGTSAQQIRSVSSEIGELGKEKGSEVFGKAGHQEGRWVVVDFVDVVVHIFDDDFRHYYDLELLWGDAPKIDWQRPDTGQPQ